MKKDIENQTKHLLSLTKHGILRKAYMEFMSVMRNGTKGPYMGRILLYGCFKTGGGNRWRKMNCSFIDRK